MVAHRLSPPALQRDAGSHPDRALSRRRGRGLAACSAKWSRYFGSRSDARSGHSDRIALPARAQRAGHGRPGRITPPIPVRGPRRRSADRARATCRGPIPSPSCSRPGSRISKATLRVRSVLHERPRPIRSRRHEPVRRDRRRRIGALQDDARGRAHSETGRGVDGRPEHQRTPWR